MTVIECTHLTWPPGNRFHHLQYLFAGAADVWYGYCLTDNTAVDSAKTRGQMFSTCLFDARRRLKDAA